MLENLILTALGLIGPNLIHIFFGGFVPTRYCLYKILLDTVPSCNIKEN